VRIHLRHAGSAALAAAVLAGAGCGSGDSEGAKPPPSVSDPLIAEIDAIERRVDANVAGACDDIFENVEGGNFDATSRLIDSIPSDVDPDIRSALSDSMDSFQQLVSSECDEIRAREQDEEVVPEDPLPEETTPEETETTPPETETTPEETETTPETPPADPGNGNGQGPDGTGPPGQDEDNGGIEAPGL